MQNLLYLFKFEQSTSGNTESHLTIMHCCDSIFNNYENNNYYYYTSNCYYYGVVQEVHTRVLGKGQELLSRNAGRFEINQLLIADDTALLAGSEESFVEYAKAES